MVRVVAAAAILAWPVAHLLLPDGAPAGVVLQGAVFGSLYAFGAVGIVLVYRATRIVNFAQAELGSIAAVVAVHLGAQRGWNYFATVAIGLVLAALGGAAVERLIIRRFRNAPRLILAVVTIGVAQILNGASIVLAIRLSKDAATGTFVTPFGGKFVVHPITFGGDYIVAIVVVPLVLGAFGWFLRSTDHGVAVRAAADSTDRAQLCGIPVRRLSTLVWTIAGVLSALAVILRVPITGFISFTSISLGGTSLLVRTLAAAVIARMESLTVAAVAAVGLGVFEAIAAWNTGNATIVDALLVAVILLALLGQRRRERREEETALHTTRFQALREVRPIPAELSSLPEVRIGRAVMLIGILAFAVTLPVWLSPSREQLASIVLVYAIVAVGLVVLTGWAGQISLGHWALVGIGGAATAALHVRQGWDLFYALPAGVLISGLVALLIGLPALRIRGPFLAVSTLAFALTASTFILQPRHLPWFVTERFDRPVLWGRVTLEQDWRLYVIALVALVVVIAVVRSLRRSRAGRVLIAVRDNEPAAQAVGVPATRLKLVAFVISGAIAGLAGSVYVIVQNGVRPDAFGPEVSLRIFSMAVIGGLGSVPGAILGAVYVRGAEFFLPSGWALVASGAGILILLFFAPGGLGELLFRARDALLRRIADRRGLVVPSLIADVGGKDVAPRRPPRRRTGEGLLELNGVDVAYDRVQVVFGVDLVVREGEMVALLGTNGAGKSTLLRAISGLLEPTAGSISFDGKAIGGDDPERVAALGIGQMPGGRSVFPMLTVQENLRMAGWRIRRNADELNRSTEEMLLAFPILRQRLTTKAGALSGGEQQMLGLAQTLLSRPRLLLIDELSLGLAPIVVDELLEVVREIHRRGTTVVIVEQSVTTALRFAERAVFMEKGEVRYDGPAARLTSKQELLRAVFLGKPSRLTGGSRSNGARTRNGVALSVEGLTKSYGGLMAVEDVSIDVRSGEIVGVIGPNGAGKTTLFDMITGLIPPDDGVVRLGDATATEWPAHVRACAGLGRSFQHARLWPSLTVREAIAVARERHLREPHTLHALFGLPQSRESEQRVSEEVDELIDLLGLKAFRDKFVSELSTGSRRIVEIATILAHEPSVVLLDEPSSGIAQRETEALGPLLRRVQRETGCSMVVIEHDMRLITKLADRIVALDRGAVIAEGLPRNVMRHPRVVESYLGSVKRKTPKRAKARA